MKGRQNSDQAPPSGFRIRMADEPDEIKRSVDRLDFSSRAVKLRLFALVCGVMLVLVLMFEARNPDNWNWMGFKSAEPNIDTRYLANIYPQDSSSKSESSKEDNKSSDDNPKVESKSDAKNGLENKQSESAGTSNPTIDENQNADQNVRPEFQIAEKDFW